MKVLFTKKTDKVEVTGKLSDDKLKLFIDVVKLDTSTVTGDNLTFIIKEFVKEELLDLAVLEDIAKSLHKGEKVSERRIAKGKATEVGQDGKILLLVKKFSKQADIRPDSKGFVNYSDLHLFDNITKDQILGRIYPPKKGADGVSALGEVLPGKLGQLVKPKIDKTIVVKKSERSDEEFEVLVSQAEGMLVEDQGILGIKDQLNIDGDLDFAWGNIDFIGKVVIKGEALKGFTVKAKKGIELNGGLSGANLNCAEGEIKIKGLARSSEISRVISSGDLTLNMAQELDAEVAGNIIITKQALDCKLRSAKGVSALQGEIIGGKTYAVCGVEAKNIGNQRGITTEIFLCSDIETTAEYMRLAAEIQSHEKAFELLKLHLGPLAQNPARIQLLKEPHRGKMQKLLAKLREVEGSKVKLDERRAAMLLEGHSSQSTRVNVIDTIYDGVVIHAGKNEYKQVGELKGPKSIDYLSKEERFEVGALKPLECQMEQTKTGGGNVTGKPEKAAK